MNCAHEPHDVACSTASQAWNIAESREPPVPRPPLLMHPASAAVPAATRAPANTTDVIIKRLKLRIGSLLPSKTKRQRAGAHCPRSLSLHTGQSRTFVRDAIDSSAPVAGRGREPARTARAARAGLARKLQ